MPPSQLSNYKKNYMKMMKTPLNLTLRKSNFKSNLGFLPCKKKLKMPEKHLTLKFN
jgi:hypothetical protein